MKWCLLFVIFISKCDFDFATAYQTLVFDIYRDSKKVVKCSDSQLYVSVNETYYIQVKRIKVEYARCGLPNNMATIKMSKSNDTYNVFDYKFKALYKPNIYNYQCEFYTVKCKDDYNMSVLNICYNRNEQFKGITCKITLTVRKYSGDSTPKITTNTPKISTIDTTTSIIITTALPSLPTSSAPKITDASSQTSKTSSGMEWVIAVSVLVTIALAVAALWLAYNYFKRRRMLKNSTLDIFYQNFTDTRDGSMAIPEQWDRPDEVTYAEPINNYTAPALKNQQTEQEPNYAVPNDSVNIIYQNTGPNLLVTAQNNGPPNSTILQSEPTLSSIQQSGPTNSSILQSGPTFSSIHQNGPTNSLTQQIEFANSSKQNIQQGNLLIQNIEPTYASVQSNEPSYAPKENTVFMKKTDPSSKNPYQNFNSIPGCENAK